MLEIVEKCVLEVCWNSKEVIWTGRVLIREMSYEARKDLKEVLLNVQSNGKGKESAASNSPVREPRVHWKNQRNPPSLRMKSFKRTVRTLQLDHSQKWWGFFSWIVGFVMILVIPILRLIYVKSADDVSDHKLIYQPIVVVFGILISAVSYIFLSHSMRKYGLTGIIFLDSAAEEPPEIQEEYNRVIESGATQLAKLFIPALVLYILQKCWFYIDIPLASLPHLNSKIANVVIISVLVGLSWIFQTTTFLYTCVLFWKVCFLQELRMKLFKDLLPQGLDPEYYYYKFEGIAKCLQSTSRRFRLFLALAGFLTVFSALFSMYEVVAHREGFNILMSGELVVLNLVNLIGIGLCLRSASRLAHLHRRIVKAASIAHAKKTFETSKGYLLPSSGKDQSLEFSEKMERFCQAQDACSQRTALVNFLSNNVLGISVYGFVLDRFFVHTSVGALLTTTWFILGQSLAS